MFSVFLFNHVPSIAFLKNSVGCECMFTENTTLSSSKSKGVGTACKTLLSKNTGVPLLCILLLVKLNLSISV